MAKVSIVIPCYNSAEVLRETLESACAQADVDREVLVVDDGSTDDTVAVAKSVSPAVRVISGPNRGISFARNWGIAETQGEWLVFLDHDDLLLPRTLAKRLSAASSTGSDVIVCDYVKASRIADGVFDREVRHVDFEFLKAKGEVACVDAFSITTAALMYRRDVVERTGGFREDLPIIQDQRFLFDAAHHNACFGYSKHVGAEYRVLPGSVSHRNPIVVWHDILENARQIETLWRTQGQLSAVQEDELARVYNYLARNFFSAGDDAYFRAVKYLQGTTDRLPLHARIAEPLASAFGLRMAQRALRFPSALMEFSRRCLSRGHIEATIE